MRDLVTDISVQIDIEDDKICDYFTKEKLNKTAKELAYIEGHLDKYKSYDNILELEKDLLED